VKITARKLQFPFLLRSGKIKNWHFETEELNSALKFATVVLPVCLNRTVTALQRAAVLIWPVRVYSYFWQLFWFRFPYLFLRSRVYRHVFSCFLFLFTDSFIIAVLSKPLGLY
jgi:hypothetical protein